MPWRTKALMDMPRRSKSAYFRAPRLMSTMPPGQLCQPRAPMTAPAPATPWRLNGDMDADAPMDAARKPLNLCGAARLRLLQAGQQV